MAAQYEVIASKLRVAIERGEYPAGSTLPKQELIAEQEGVSIKTVRSAINLLASQGIVTPVRRRGTVVRESPSRIALGGGQDAVAIAPVVYDVGVGRVSRALSRRGLKADNQDLSLIRSLPLGAEGEMTDASQAVAAALNIEVGSEVYRREFILADHPRVLTRIVTTYMPGRISDALRRKVYSHDDGECVDPLIAYELADIELGNVAETLVSRMPTLDERTWLDMPEGEPVVEVHRYVQLANGDPIEYSISVCRSPFFEWTYQIRHS